MSITETLMVERTSVPVQTRTSLHKFRLAAEFDNDEGLVMLLDRKKEQQCRNPQTQTIGSPVLRTSLPQMCGQNLSTSPLLQTSQNYYAKSLNQLNALIIDKVTKRIVPLLLYASLFVLAMQALAVLLIMLNSVQSWGLWFLLTCGSVIGFLFCFTSQANLFQQLTPPPTPSHSSTSLHS